MVLAATQAASPTSLSSLPFVKIPLFRRMTNEKVKYRTLINLIFKMFPKHISDLLSEKKDRDQSPIDANCERSESKKKSEIRIRIAEIQKKV